ncbi:MAG: nucleotidyltransferase family protein [Agathobacter sp.]|nr:nucleotidyltransferase family protein [Agathobacter sp.]
MKVVGIVAEYNPFHNGHQYQIDKVRKKTGADYVIVAMSGNFLQRGVPALCDKFIRAEMALKCGADLVIEIPTLWATASAEYYAHAGVALLASTGVVTHLAFGAETDDLDALLQVSSILKNEPDVYRAVLSNSIRTGNSFPVARKNALITSLPLFPTEKLDELLDNPNNILALEYLKALPDSIEPILIQREGAGYHDTEIHTELPSASAIREAIFGCNGDIDMDVLANAMPKESFVLLKNALKCNQLLETNDFSQSLGYCLLAQAGNGFASFADCNQDFSNKVKNNLNNYVLFEDFIGTLKTKDMTYTRVSRCLLHILLGIKQSDYTIGRAIGFAPYLRILGFKNNSSSLLSEMKRESTVPIISKAADASTLLDYETNKFFDKDVFASNLYYQHVARKSGTKPKNEYTNQIVIL